MPFTSRLKVDAKCVYQQWNWGREGGRGGGVCCEVHKPTAQFCSNTKTSLSGPFLILQNAAKSLSAVSTLCVDLARHVPHCLANRKQSIP